MPDYKTFTNIRIIKNFNDLSFSIEVDDFIISNIEKYEVLAPDSKEPDRPVLVEVVGTYNGSKFQFEFRLMSKTFTYENYKY